MPEFLPGAIQIVHEDRDILVVDKPTGMLTASQPGDDLDSVFREVKVHVRNKVKRRGTQTWIIHRLDKEASGLLVFAKTEAAFVSLKEQFRAKRAQRVYVAVVEGEIAPVADGKVAKAPLAVAGTIQSFLIENEDGIVRSIPNPAAGSRGPDQALAKLAVTHYRVAEHAYGRSLMHVRLETGRKNQIRVHMKDMGHPIVGDFRYGATTDFAERLCLHATELGFTHPTTGKHIQFRSTIPPAFFKLVGKKPTDAPIPPIEASSVVASHGPASHKDQKPAQKPEPREKVDKFNIQKGGKGKVEPVMPEVAEVSAEAPVAEEPPAAAAAKPGRGPHASWDHVADWYTTLLDDRGSDHHERIIIPAALRLLNVRPGMRILDVACGQGLLARRFAAEGARVMGVDSSPKLISVAKAQGAPKGSGAVEYRVGDARTLGVMPIGPFDAACCAMALMNIDPISSVLSGIAAKLEPGGVCVAIMLHPAFRAPGQSAWGWDSPPDPEGHSRPRGKGGRKDRARTPREGGEFRQYRRIDGYLSPGQKEIVMNPGSVARGANPIMTVTYHRPLEHYVRAFAAAGFAIDALEEWPSLRASEPGPRAAEENRSRREIPMFLVMRAMLLPGGKR